MLLGLVEPAGHQLGLADVFVGAAVVRVVPQRLVVVDEGRLELAGLAVREAEPVLGRRVGLDARDIALERLDRGRVLLGLDLRDRLRVLRVERGFGSAAAIAAGGQQGRGRQCHGGGHQQLGETQFRQFHRRVLTPRVRACDAGVREHGAEYSAAAVTAGAASTRFEWLVRVTIRTLRVAVDDATAPLANRIAPQQFRRAAMSMRHWLCIVPAVALLAAIAGPAAAQKAGTQIGAIVPESWPDRGRAEDIRNGMMLALKTWPGGPAPTFVVKDSACKPQQAQTAAQSLVEAKVDVVIGGFCVVGNVPRVLQAAGVPFVSANAERFATVSDSSVQLGSVPANLADGIASKLRTETGLRVTAGSSCWIDYEPRVPDGYDAILCPTLD